MLAKKGFLLKKKTLNCLSKRVKELLLHLIEELSENN